MVAAVAILALGGLIFQKLYPGNAGGLTAKIYLGDELLAAYPLKGSEVSYQFQGQISPVEITVGAKGAAFKSSGCPDHICIKSGNLSHIGENAACLPNKILLVIRQNA